MLRVSIYDDNDSLRETLAMVVEMTDELVLAGSYPDAMQVLETVANDVLDVILMDIEMLQRTGSGKNLTSRAFKAS